MDQRGIITRFKYPSSQSEVKNTDNISCCSLNTYYSIAAGQPLYDYYATPMCRLCAAYEPPMKRLFKEAVKRRYTLAIYLTYRQYIIG